jgi:hypothetical protein
LPDGGILRMGGAFGRVGSDPYQGWAALVPPP